MSNCMCTAVPYTHLDVYKRQGFIVTTEDGSFYYSGDTCLTMDMKLIPDYAGLYAAILPIGGHYTMDVEDALMASNFIQCDKVVGVHFDTWPPISIDREKGTRLFEAAGKQLILPALKETITL